MNFDLNIDNYSLDELIEMFELPQDYDKNMVEHQENKLRENILNNKSMQKDIASSTLQFIDKVKNTLLNNMLNQKTLKESYKITQNELEPVDIASDNSHMVQMKKSVLYNYNPVDFYPGVINPLKKKFLKKNLNIDTRFRENYYGSLSTNFNITLPMIINNVVTMQLSAIEMPTTYYNISNKLGNNFLKINVIDATNETFTQMIVLPNGKYNTSLGFINILNSIVNSLGGYFAYLVFYINNNSINNPDGNGQMVVNINPSYTGVSFRFELDFQTDIVGNPDTSTPLPLKLGWLMGFRNGKYINNTVYVGEGILDLLSRRYIYLAIDDFNNSVNSNNYISAFSTSILSRNIIARITIAPGPFTVFLENKFVMITNPREYFGPVTIKNLNIQLLDEYGRIIDLNNMDFSFCLTFQTIYDM